MFRALHVTNIIREGCQPRIYLNIHPFNSCSGYFFHVTLIDCILLYFQNMCGCTIFLYKSAWTIYMYIRIYHQDYKMRFIFVERVYMLYIERCVLYTYYLIIIH